MVRSEAQLAYELMEMYRANNRVSDSLDIRLFKTWIPQARAAIIKQRLDANPNSIDESLVQDLGDVDFAPVDSSSNIAFPSGKYMMRSALPIPTTVNTRSGLATFTRIAPADLLEAPWNLVSYRRALTSGNGRFNGNDVYTFLSSGYLYTISKNNKNKYVTSVNIKGIFANPIEAYEFRYGAGTWNEDNEYPVSESVVMDMMNMIIDKKFKLILTQVEDKQADGADGTTVTKTR